MDIFSHYSDPLPFVSDFQPFDMPEMSSISDGTSRPVTFSDEEVLLASRNPKRRAGRKKFRETRHPVFRGVRRRNSDKWVCEVREPNKKSRIWLGTFPTAEMAARAHDVAALALRGRSACLNFADSAWRLPIPFSADAKDIQKAAAEAAEAFRPSEFDGVVSSNEIKPTVDDVFYMDEEEPGLLASMAEGLLLSPPPCVGDGLNWDYVESDTELPLWSYSI